MSQVLKTIAQPVYDSLSFRETDAKHYFTLLAEFTKIALLTNMKKNATEYSKLFPVPERTV